MNVGNSVLELQNIGVTYRDGTRPRIAVTDFSLDLKPGEIVGLAGPNGAGKTSVLEVCLGTLPVNTGQVLWFGAARRDNRVKASIGVCPDVPAFPSRLTAREVLLMHAAIGGIEPAEANRRIAAYDGRLRLGPQLDHRVETLSRGTAQRLGVFQALVCRPDILLCDETFAPLDPIAQTDVRELLREEADRGAAIVVSSHQLPHLARIVDRMLIMKGGRIVRTLHSGLLQAKCVMAWRQTERGVVDEQHWDKLYPGSWQVGTHRFAVFVEAGLGHGGGGEPPPCTPPGFAFVGYQRFSVEDAFQESMQAAHTSDPRGDYRANA